METTGKLLMSRFLVVSSRFPFLGNRFFHPVNVLLKKNKLFITFFDLIFWIDLAEANVGFIATSFIMGIVMIVMIVGIVFYVVKQKRYSLSTNSVGQNYELPTVPKPTNEYEEIRNKIDNNVSEYRDIGIFYANTSRSEYRNIE